MSTFLKKIVFLILGVFVLLFLLDILYTSVYSNSIPRNKTQYVLGLNEAESIDYVFLGSSRVENTIMSSVIENLTGKRTINLGTQGARLYDMNIFLRLLISKKIKIEQLFVQVDYIYNFESSSDIVRSQVLPYIRDNDVINNYLSRVDSNYLKHYYLPFYRYAVNDYRLGFRAFFASTINKASKIDFNDGFVPRHGVMKTSDSNGFDLPKTILKSNKSIDEIITLCKTNDIKVTFFCAPFCSQLRANDYLLKLKSKLSSFEDFSGSIKHDSLFENCGHLNKKGAEAFSNIIVNRLNL